MDAEGGPLFEESLQMQIQTLDMPRIRSPPSVLAFSADETVGFMRAGFALLRSIRSSQISSLCLDASDFDPLERLRAAGLRGNRDQRRGRHAGRVLATIEPSAELGHDLLHIRGLAEHDTWYAGWYVEFRMVFRLDRGDVPRDPLPGELPPELSPAGPWPRCRRGSGSWLVEKCAGGDREAIEEEEKAIAEEKNALPRRSE